ncbi:hypothetical protein ACIRJ3_03825 [Streptomyces anulatus]
MSASKRDALTAAVELLGALPMPVGEPMPVELTEQQMEALIDAGNRALNDHYHERQCHCDAWPTSCVSSDRYFMGAWDTDAFAIGVPVVLGVWELLRNDRHAAKVAELRARVAELEAQRERRRVRLVALQNDALNVRGSLSPADEARKVPFELGETLTPAVDWLINRVAELEALKPARFQDCRVCGSGYEYGQPCSGCEFKKQMAAAQAGARDALPRDLSPEQARRIERDRPETNTAHDCNLPLVRRLDCGHCPHEVCQDCDRCPHTCRCASAEVTS